MEKQRPHSEVAISTVIGDEGSENIAGTEK